MGSCIKECLSKSKKLRHVVCAFPQTPRDPSNGLTRVNSYNRSQEHDLFYAGTIYINLEERVGWWSPVAVNLGEAFRRRASREMSKLRSFLENPHRCVEGVQRGIGEHLIVPASPSIPEQKENESGVDRRKSMMTQKLFPPGVGESTSR